MEGELATTGTLADYGAHSWYWEVLWQKICVLGSVVRVFRLWSLTNAQIGWGKYMEWKYPVNVVIGDHAAFRGAGVVGAALPL